MLSLITNGLLTLVEREFVNYEPEMQATLASELVKASNMLVAFIAEKLPTLGDKHE